MTPFRWTKVREQAALLVSEDRLSNKDIAEEVGVDESTIKRWKRLPDFEARVAEYVSAVRAALEARGISDKQNRVDLLDRIVKRLVGLIDARAADPLCLVAGRESGLMLTKKVSYIASPDGEEIGRVEEYATDGVVLKELREYLKQAAQEIGQWVEKGELTGKDGQALNSATVIILPDNGRGDAC